MTERKYRELPEGSETIAHLVFEYNGKRYPLDYSFGNDYDMGAAEFMWNEGNYSCDDNRSIFLHQKYPDEVAEIDECGGTIKLVEEWYEGPAPANFLRCCHCNEVIGHATGYDDDSGIDCGKPAHISCIVALASEPRNCEETE